MPNVKFSGFSAITSVGANGFLVGYDSVTNLNTRITLANLKTSIGAFTFDQTLAAGATLTASRTIDVVSNIFKTTSSSLGYDFGISINPTAAKEIILGSALGQGPFIKIKTIGVATSYIRTGDINGNSYGFDLTGSVTKVGSYGSNTNVLQFDNSGVDRIYANVSGSGLYLNQNTNYYFGDYPSSNDLTFNTISDKFGFRIGGTDSLAYVDIPGQTMFVGDYNYAIACPSIVFEANPSPKMYSYDGSAGANGFELKFGPFEYKFGDIVGQNYIECIGGLTPSVTLASPSIIKTSNGSNDSGLVIDFTNENYSIGDTGALGSENVLVIDDPNGIIRAGNAGISNGMSLDFNNGQYLFGDYGTPGYHIIIDNANGIIQGINGLGAYGFNISPSAQEFGIGGIMKLFFDNASGSEKFYFDGGSPIALEYNYQTSITKVGLGGGNNTYLQVDGGNNNMTLFSDNEIKLDDNGTGNMLTTTGGSSVSDYLKITINGNQYLIALRQ